MLDELSSRAPLPAGAEGEPAQDQGAQAETQETASKVKDSLRGLGTTEARGISGKNQT